MNDALAETLFEFIDPLIKCVNALVKTPDL